MEDRFLRGYIAGILSGITMALLDYLLFMFGISETRYLDLVAIIFLGYVPDTIFGQAVAQIIQLGHAALVGITFVYLTSIIGAKHLIFKGATYGAIVWFSTFGICSLFKVALFYQSTPANLMSKLATSAVWGIAAALTLIWLERYDTAQESHQIAPIIAAPAYKHPVEKSPDDDTNR